MQSSVPLSTVSTCVIDEVHERDLTTDFALTLLRPILTISKRMTTSASLFVNFFRDMKLGMEPMIISIPGRTFPVRTKWLVDIETLVSDRMNNWLSNDDSDEDNNDTVLAPRAKAKIDNDFIVKLIIKIARQQLDHENGKNINEDKRSGSVLVFLPGKGEI